MLESDLYPAVKEYLEGQGYTVKGEIRDCDIVAVRDGEQPVIVELKLSFNLPLVFQGITRQTISDTVYLAVAKPASRGWGKRYKDIIKLCRMLGLGLISINEGRKGRSVEVHLDPAPYQPRKNKRRATALLREFERRTGDPSPGGSTRKPVITAYRQNALRCAHYLEENGPQSPSGIARAISVTQAGTILYKNHYGWFERVERGVYALTPAGTKALAVFGEALDSIRKTDASNVNPPDNTKTETNSR